MTAARRSTPAPRVPAARRALLGLAWTLLWMLAWGGALAFFAGRAHAAEPLTLAVSEGPVSLPIYVAEARGLFKAEGLDARVTTCRSGRDCFAMLTEGRADIATASELLVALRHADMPSIEILATISASAYQIKLVGRRSAHIVEAPQVRGRRVGTVGGTSAQYFLDSWLLFNDIDPREVTMVPLPPEHIVDALVHGEVDAVAIWEPLASSAAAALGADATTFASPRVYTQHFNLIGARSTVSARERDVERLLHALIAAQNFIADDPAGAQAVLAQRLGLTPAIAASAFAGEDYRVRLDQSLVTTMQSQSRWARRAGVASGARDGGHVNDLLFAVDPGPLRRVAPDAISLVR